MHGSNHALNKDVALAPRPAAGKESEMLLKLFGLFQILTAIGFVHCAQALLPRRERVAARVQGAVGLFTRRSL